MILKIEGMEDVWTFIGEVDDCSSQTIICETEQGFEELREKCSKAFVDSRPWGENVTYKKVRWIVCSRRGLDADLSLLCDGSVFLLSETGKTIDRL